MPKLILGAVLARCPRGAAGHTCAVMNWALSFRNLGWEVHLVECLPEKDLEYDANAEESVQERFWRETCKEFGFIGSESLLIEETPGNSSAKNSRRARWIEDREKFRAVAQEADLFLNYSGQFKRLDLLGPHTPKVYLDVDPAFTQLWAEVSHCDMNLTGHDVFWTIGRSIGSPEALLPDAGIQWTPTLPVVCADAWAGLSDSLATSVQSPNSSSLWTTVAHWYGYGAMPWQGREYTGKRESFLALRDLPGLSGLPLMLATDLQREWGDYDEFESAGWRFISSAEVCADVPAYLHFLQTSRGELGVAKGGYVTSRCGWVSDRSLVYLSLGCPVLLQETGWTRHVPDQPGLRAFSTPEEAAARLRQIEADHSSESRAAREIARTHFSPRTILLPLLDRIL